MASIFCNFCNYSCQPYQKSQYYKHLRTSHSNEPNFQVYCSHENCNRVFTKVKSLQKHWQRAHGDDDINVGIQPAGDQRDENIPPNEAEEEFNEATSKKTLQYHTAKFLLSAKEEGKVSQKALDSVKDSTQALFSEYLDNVKKALAIKIRQVNPQFTYTEGMEDLFHAEHVFDGLETEFKQRAYYLKHFNLVEPIQIGLGTKWKKVKERGRLQYKRITNYAYYVPVLKSLEALLQNPDILNEIENPHQSQDYNLHDIIDGQYCRNHPIFSKDLFALQLLGYFDDLEVANPLGSKAKIHKIGVFYYVLGNIRPNLRSTTRVVQLIAIGKSKDFKAHGLKAVFSPFTTEINELTKESGYCFNIVGQKRYFRGDVILWTGDTLGSNYVAGFKEGVGGALRICRHCMATRVEANEMFNSSMFQARDLDSHLELGNLIEDGNNSKVVRERLSTTYGINCLSVLHPISHFNVCECFPEDIMHILFEGIVPFETKLLLKYLIDERKCFTLKCLNQILASFNYGYMNQKNKPSSMITRDCLNATGDTKLKQSASQMWCLFRFLPIILGDYVEEGLEHWLCIQKLWNIVQICTSHRICVDEVSYLRVLIEEHHKFFKQIYPDAPIIPKMHYLVHVPDDILKFGPSINFWTMRFEAKHSFLKGLVSKNFKNIPKTLAFRHQRAMCWNLFTNEDQATTAYLYKGDVVGADECEVDLNDHPYTNMFYEALEDHTRRDKFIGTKVKSTIIHGVQYQPGAVLRLAEMQPNSEQDYPLFGLLDAIIVWEDEKMFLVTVLETLDFKQHYMAYHVERTEGKKVLTYNNLSWHGVLHYIEKREQKFVVDKDTASVELF